MYNKIILAGGSGYLGSVLAGFYREKAGSIIILSRSVRMGEGNTRYVQWDGKTEGPWCAELENADLLINCSGKNVNCRYTEKNRKEILSSRLEPTAILGKVIAKLKKPPTTWINLASATIYRHSEDRPQDEENGEMGTGFSVGICKAWEKTFLENETPNTKKIILRVSFVLGRNDEVHPKLLNLVRFGLGGHAGSGKQYVSWIHEMDFCRITEFVHLNGRDREMFNCTAPFAISNKELMKILRQSYGMPFGLPTPQWLLEIGAVIIGTETELVLKSRWVYPKKLLDRGFVFHFTEAGPAIRDIISTRI